MTGSLTPTELRDCTTGFLSPGAGETSWVKGTSQFESVRTGPWTLRDSGWTGGVVLVDHRDGVVGPGVRTWYPRSLNVLVGIDWSGSLRRFPPNRRGRGGRFRVPSRSTRRLSDLPEASREWNRPTPTEKFYGVTRLAPGWVERKVQVSTPTVGGSTRPCRGHRFDVHPRTGTGPR